MNGTTSVVSFFIYNYARMAELEDAWDLKSQGEIREGSIPSVSTMRILPNGKAPEFDSGKWFIPCRFEPCYPCYIGPWRKW